MSALRGASDDPYVGRIFDGRYRILRRLGEGGMGVVYEAEHTKLGKRVALKVIAPERIGDPEVAARFTREARATAQIEHPHIASGFDYGLLPEGGAFLVAQLVRGSSLRERIDGGPTPWPEACEIAAQIADALSEIHRAGYVHRDLTPENVLVTTRDDGRAHVYVLDFGVAALLAASSDSPTPLTEAGTVVGTNGYMSPEQALGRPLDPRADLYVLGVLLWEMIAGRPLFTRSSSMTEIVTAQLSGALDLFPIAAASGSLPFDLERLLRDLSSSDPARRPASAAELRATLLRIAEGRPAPSGAVDRASPALGIGLPAPAPIVNLELELERAALALRSATRTVVSALGRREGRAAVAIGAVAAVLGTILLGLIALAIPDAPVARAPKPPVLAGADIPRGRSAPEPIGEIAARVDEMMTATLHRERESAAGALIEADPATVPPYARAVAQLVLANTCDDRAEALADIRTIADPSAIPALERMRDAPRRGCGRGGRSDCYACVRQALDATLAALVAAPPHP